MTFDEAFRWTVEHDAVVRFLVEPATGIKKVRVGAFINVETEERAVAITEAHPSDTDARHAFVQAVEQVQAQWPQRPTLRLVG